MDKHTFLVVMKKRVNFLDIRHCLEHKRKIIVYMPKNIQKEKRKQEGKSMLCQNKLTSCPLFNVFSPVIDTLLMGALEMTSF